MNTTIRMSKYQGLGNDYLVLDPNKNKEQLQGKKISVLCKRGHGIGADGILYGPTIKDNTIGVKIYNPDGSETAMSGNGIRIFAKYLFDHEYVTEKKFEILTEHGPMKVEILNDRATEIKVEMGKASFMSTDIMVLGEEREVVNEPFLFNGHFYNASCASLGNPHCVIMMEQVTKEIVKEIGPFVENAKEFPNRMNLQIVKVIDRGNIQMEIYERGAGYTLASGSGSCAAAAVARRLGLVDDHLNVNQPGGTITVEFLEDGTMYMIGSVGFVADIRIAEEFLS